MVASSAELIREFAVRARNCQLEVDCLGDGRFDAELVIVAEAPGEQECRQKLPLVGGSGQKLWEHLRPHGLNRTKVYTTNVVKRRLAFDNKGKVQISKNELDHWHGLLRWELSQLPNVKYVLLLGGMALEALTGEQGIDKWRGSVITRDGITYVCAHNPANVMRRPELEVIFKLDMGKLDLVLRGQYGDHPIEAQYDLTPKEIIDACDRLQDERKPIAFDIETIAGETACIGLANDPHKGVCINFRDRTTNRFSIGEELDVRLRVARLLAEPSIRLVAQNGNFDRYWLWYKDRIRVHRVWHDTLLAHHTLYPSLPHGLGFLVAQYSTHPYYKDEKDTWREGGDISTFWEYNVKDACLTLHVSSRLDAELRAQKLDEFFYGHVMRLHPHLAPPTVFGVKIDLEMKSQLRDTLSAELEQKEEAFYAAVAQATGDDTYRPNPLSSKQLSELLFGRLRLVGRGTSTDDTNRTHMLNHPRTRNEDKQVIINLNAFKEKHKFFSTYVETAIDGDGRFRMEYKQYGTQSAPGRLSSSGNLWGTGGNIQNQPPQARGMFIADEGYSFGYFDLSQAEARYVGWDANIVSWKHQFERARLDGGYDAHRALCAEMFGMAYEDTPAKDTEIDPSTGEEVYTKRYIAKRCRHGLNYRMMYDRLAEVTGLPIQLAMDAYYKYHAMHPELRKWWDRLIAEVKQNRMLFNSYGRRLIFLGRIDDANLDSVVAFRPQSTIGDHVSRVMYMAQEDDEWPLHAQVQLYRAPTPAQIMMNVHDSLTVLAPEAKIKTCLRIMRKYAEQPIYINGEPLIVPAEPAIAVPDDKGIIRWSNLKKLNPQDLSEAA